MSDRKQCVPRVPTAKNIFPVSITQMARFSTNGAMDLLQLLSEATEKMYRVRSFSLATNPFALEILDSMAQASERRKLRRTLERMRKRRFIQIEKQGKKLLVSLTKQGKFESVRRAIVSNKNPLPPGQFCIVVFDIPEHVRGTRDRFRFLLKSSGFRRFQRSVWISPYLVGGDLGKFVTISKVEKWVSIFYAAIKTA